MKNGNKPEEKLIVSACLAGFPCRYDGKAQTDPEIEDLVKCGKAVPVCPEALGGLPTPRVPCEIVGGSGEDVLAGSARVIAFDGRIAFDCTDAFIKGARAALKAAKDIGAARSVLKANSPSCGFGTIYDGSFSGTRKPGSGVAAALLSQNGITIESR